MSEGRKNYTDRTASQTIYNMLAVETVLENEWVRSIKNVPMEKINRTSSLGRLGIQLKTANGKLKNKRTGNIRL